MDEENYSLTLSTALFSFVEQIKSELIYRDKKKYYLQNRQHEDEIKKLSDSLKKSIDETLLDKARKYEDDGDYVSACTFVQIPILSGLDSAFAFAIGCLNIYLHDGIVSRKLPKLLTEDVAKKYHEELEKAKLAKEGLHKKQVNNVLVKFVKERLAQLHQLREIEDHLTELYKHARERGKNYESRHYRNGDHAKGISLLILLFISLALFVYLIHSYVNEIASWITLALFICAGYNKYIKK